MYIYIYIYIYMKGTRSCPVALEKRVAASETRIWFQSLGLTCYGSSL